jgi:hypothetical protein
MVRIGGIDIDHILIIGSCRRAVTNPPARVPVTLVSPTPEAAQKQSHKAASRDIPGIVVVIGSLDMSIREEIAIKMDMIALVPAAIEHKMFLHIYTS